MVVSMQIGIDPVINNINKIHFNKKNGVKAKANNIV
jgi:hypothetical protein